MAEIHSTCIVCGAQFSYTHEGSGRRRLFCTGECKTSRKAEQMASYRTPPQYQSTCKRCGSSFIAKKPGAFICSVACRQALKRVRKKAQGWKRPPQHTYWAIKRARKRTAQVEPVDPMQVFARDKWRCHLCGVKTRQSKRGTTEALAPELDHIVPLSQGGEHSYRNTACACRSCNSAKGARMLGQMRLFG